MAKLDMVMLEEDDRTLHGIISRLLVDSFSKAIFLVDKSGQQLGIVGDSAHLDVTSLASLTAGNVAATDGLAKLIGEKEFSLLFHEGERDNLHISMVGKRGILVVIFDKQSTLALVRLRVKKASRDLEVVFNEIEERAQAAADAPSKYESPFSEITDEDIDRLFGD